MDIFIDYDSLKNKIKRGILEVLNGFWRVLKALIILLSKQVIPIKNSISHLHPNHKNPQATTLPIPAF